MVAWLKLHKKTMTLDDGVDKVKEQEGDWTKERGEKGGGIIVSAILKNDVNNETIINGGKLQNCNLKWVTLL